MDFILQNIADTQKLLADGPTTTTKAVLNYSDNDSDLKIKIEISGANPNVSNALVTLFQVTVLGDKTSGKFKFSSHQTKLEDHLGDDDIDDKGLSDNTSELI